MHQEAATKFHDKRVILRRTTPVGNAFQRRTLSRPDRRLVPRILAGRSGGGRDTTVVLAGKRSRPVSTHGSGDGTRHITGETRAGITMSG